MSFFIKSGRRNNANAKKRPGATGVVKAGKKTSSRLPQSKKLKRDVEISSDEDDSDGALIDPPSAAAGDNNEQLPIEGGDSGESDTEETAEQKKLRLAKEYLAGLRQREDEEAEDQEQKHSLIAHRLKRDLLEQSGRLFKPLALSLQPIQPDESIHLKNQHRLPITRAVLSPDEKFLFSASKDGTLVRWSLDVDARRGQRTTRVKNAHSAAILALAISSDGRYLASGCAKNELTVWNPDSLEKIHTFGTYQHRAKVTGLAFRYGTHQLVSCSADRSVKVWSLDEMAYVETVFGHEDTITSIDSFLKDRALSSGGRDGTLRLWKIPEESQLVYTSNQSSVDCCAMLNDDTFVSGHDDGCVYLWKAIKKKPVAKAPVSTHGHWVTAIGVVRSSDLVAAGSNCGYIVLFVAENIQRGSEGRCGLKEVQRIACVGFVNSLSFSSSARILLAAVSQEHAFGRWERIREAKNDVRLFPLKYAS